MGACEYLPWLAKCMSAIICINQSLMFFSMPIMLNRRFRPTMSQLFIMQSPHWKPFTERGPVGLAVQNFSCSPLPFMPHARRSTSTMRRQPNLLRTSCRWVRVLSLILHLDVAYISLVLNPKKNMEYFKKHWSTKLQEEVLKCVEEEVYLSFCLPF